jgi:hypothetical protein
MPQSKSFWSTVPGMLTGIAGVIGAVTGLYVALHTTPSTKPVNPNPTSPETSSSSEALDPSKWPLVAEETFTKGDSHWAVGSLPDENTSRLDLRVFDGKYRWDAAFVKTWYRGVFSPYGSVVNFAVAVDVRFAQVAANTIGAYLAFGWTNNQEYDFYVSSNREFSLLKVGPNRQSCETLINPTRITDEFELSAWNRMRVVVDGQLISCYLNSKLVSDYKDSGFTGGPVGLGVGGSEGAAGVVDFDNFELRRKP